MSAAAQDAFLDLPLDGVRLIEASAGTGKTFTLATLVTRLVIERGLRVGQILAVTYTEAATQELRERLRLRLELAARLANEVALMPTALDDDDSEAAVTRELITRQARHEDPLSRGRCGGRNGDLQNPCGARQVHHTDWTEFDSAQLAEQHRHHELR